MITTLPATYEHGVLRLKESLPIPEQAVVTVTVEFDLPDEKVMEDAWRDQGKAALASTWDNEADEVFNELAA